MTKSRADQMVERLQTMQASAPDIEASAIVSVDGLIMASALQQGVEEVTRGILYSGPGKPSQQSGKGSVVVVTYQ